GVVGGAGGRVRGEYGFGHRLYQNVLYHHLSEVRRVRFHQALGMRLEAGYGVHTAEIAAELAVHFERGRDWQRAVQYLQQAAENATRRSADREAIGRFTRG